MLKIVLCINRKPGMTREEFHSYWANEHRQVLHQVAEPLGMRRNVHNRTLDTGLENGIREGRGAMLDDFDGVAETWFDSLDALKQNSLTEEGRAAARLLAEDEMRFIDFSTSKIFFVEEETVINRQ